MTCLVTYDIEDNKIRGKLSRFLEGKGVRLQKSVFAVKIERHIFKEFLSQMENITGKDAQLAVFRLCSGCQKNALQISCEEKDYYVF